MIEKRQTSNIILMGGGLKKYFKKFIIDLVYNTFIKNWVCLIWWYKYTNDSAAVSAASRFFIRFNY